MGPTSDSQAKILTSAYSRPWCVPPRCYSSLPHLYTIMASVGGVEQSKPPPDYESGVLPLHYTSGKAHRGLIGLVGSEDCWWCWGSHGLVIRPAGSPTCMTTCDGSSKVLLPIVKEKTGWKSYIGVVWNNLCSIYQICSHLCVLPSLGWCGV